MIMLPLKFKMKYIREFENKHGPLLKVIQDITKDVDNDADVDGIVVDGDDGEDIKVGDAFFDLDLNELIVDFVIAGNLGCDLERAYDIIDNFYEAGGDMTQALSQIIKGLQKGFFPRA